MAEPREGLRWIERCWDAPMANERITRIRFVMWDAMEFAAKLAERHSKKAAAAIRAELANDHARFTADGHDLRRDPPEAGKETHAADDE